MATHFVILSSFNRPRLVRLAIRSVLCQTVRDWRLVVADDGSDARTLGSIKAEISGDHRCLVLSSAPDGSVRRRDGARRATLMINTALRLVEGEIIHYLCDDDIFHRERLEVFDSLFSNKAVEVGYGRLGHLDVSGRTIGGPEFPQSVADPRSMIDHCQFAHRASVMGGMPSWPIPADGFYAIDSLFLTELAKHHTFSGIDRTVAFKRFHPHNMLFGTKDRTTSRREEGPLRMALRRLLGR